MHTSRALAVGLVVPVILFAGVFALLRWQSPVGVPVPWRLFAFLLVLTAIVVVVAVIARKRGLAGPFRTEPRFLRTTRRKIIWSFVPAALFLAAIPVIRGGHGSYLAAFLQHAPMVCSLIGIGLIGAAFVRSGSEPRCAACGYDVSGAPQPADPGDRCPECGTEFRVPGGTVVGERRVHRGLVVMGVVLVAGQFVWYATLARSPSAMMGWYTPYLPTGSLIREVTGAPRGFTRDEWAELNTRTLTPDDEVRLARGLIELRARQHYMDPAAETWLDAYAKSGGMPADLLERFCAEWLDLWLVAPARVRVGESVTIGLAGDYRGNIGAAGGGAALVARIVFEGFRVGDDPEPQARAVTSIHGMRLMSTEILNDRMRGSTRSRPDALGDRSPQLTVTPNVQGTLRIRAAVWIIVNPQASGLNPVVWNDDGTPVLPADAVWTKRVELERTIEVDP
ncbi:MAG: hypothetical protein ACKVU4_06240 [Phycisphaerales bacterium]